MNKKCKQIKQVKMELELPLSTKQKKLIISGIITAATIGFLVGYKTFNYKSGKALDKLWQFDPTLKEHMWKTLNDYVTLNLNN